MIAWLRPGEPFPGPESALQSPNGLLAASRDLSRSRLLDAYRRGIFPWYSEGEPVLWWSPHPRMVLFVDELRVSRSLRNRVRSVCRDDAVSVTLDCDFRAVIEACSGPRKDQDGTWITPEMIEAYCDLQRCEHAHSVEIWQDDALVGGLYGVAVGRMFYGESMFSRISDASKIALVALVQLLKQQQGRVIDCQQKTQHLASLGAREIDRTEFCAQVSSATVLPPIDWSAYRLRSLNHLLSSY